MKNKTAVVSVVYPAAEKYLHDFFSSLSEQTVKDFDILLILDGSDKIDIYTRQYPSLRIKYKKCSGSIAYLRNEMIDTAIENGYENIIFCDSDDSFTNNRIEGCIAMLEEADMCVNDVHLTDENNKLIFENYLGKRIDNGKQVIFSDIETSNFCGMSNTAVRASAVPAVRFDNSLIAVDWFLFSVMLLENKSCIFTSDFATCYRQHGSNTAGFSVVSEQRVKKAIEVKAAHYKELQKVYPAFRKSAEFFCTLNKKAVSPQFIAEYMKKFPCNKAFPLWWEEAAYFEGELHDPTY